jgi:hypothetical protein
MTRSQHPCLWAAIVGCFLSPAICDAQQRYEPARPTVSPYLNLFRENRGVIPNYQSLVRPQLQQQATNQYQAQQLQKQAQSLRELQAAQLDFEQNVQAGVIAPTGKSAWFARPGGRSTYLNTSRYYSNAGTIRGRY